MDGLDMLQYLGGEPRFHSMGTIALLDEHDGILLRLKARLAGVQQVMKKPLVRQRIVALVSEYACRRASAQEANQRAGNLTCDDGGVASCPGRSACDGTASTPSE